MKNNTHTIDDTRCALCNLLGVTAIDVQETDADGVKEGLPRYFVVDPGLDFDGDIIGAGATRHEALTEALETVVELWLVGSTA